MAATFWELVEQGKDRKGWSDYQLSAAIGLLPGDKAFNPTQIRRLRLGERRTLTLELVERLIEVLDLDAGAAWFHSGLRAPWISLDDYRTLRERRSDRELEAVRAQGKRTKDQLSVLAGQRPALHIVAGEKDVAA